MRRRKTQNYHTVGGNNAENSNGETTADAQGAGDAAANGDGTDAAGGTAMVDAGPAPDEGAPPPVAAASATPELTSDERVAALQLERDELKDRMLRIAAEFENWK